MAILISLILVGAFHFRQVVKEMKDTQTHTSVIPKICEKNAIFGGAFILMCGVELVVRMKKKNRNTHIYEYANEKKKEGREKERKKREAWTACFFYDLLDYCYYYYHYFQVYAQ